MEILMFWVFAALALGLGAIAGFKVASFESRFKDKLVRRLAIALVALITLMLWAVAVLAIGSFYRNDCVSFAILAVMA